MKFREKKLEERSYITSQALPTIIMVKLINQREFATTTFKKNAEIFIM